MLLMDFCCSTLLSTRVFPETPQALKCFQIARRIQNEGRALNTEIQSATEQMVKSMDVPMCTWHVITDSSCLRQLRALRSKSWAEVM